MFCSKCGRKNKDGKYCSFCGSLLNKNVLDFESTKTLLRSNIKLEDLPNNNEQLDRSINDGNKISAQENLHTSSESAIYTAFFDSVENAEHTAESEDNISSIGYSIKRVNSKSETFEQTKTEVNEDPSFAILAETEIDSSAETVQSEESVFVENADIEEEPLFANITSEEFEAANLPTIDEDEDITYDTFAETVTESSTETVQNEEYVSAENTDEPLFANITSEEFEVANIPSVEEAQDITYDTFAETVTESSTETVQNEEYVSAANTEFEEEPLFANITSEEFEAAELPTVDETENITYDTFAETITESFTETVQNEESVSIENADIEEEPLYEENFVSKEIIDEDKTFSFSSTDVSSVEEKQEQTESNISKITLNEREISQADKPSFTASGYSDIDPMFGPPPTMNFTVTVKPQETEKKSFFKNKFKKNKSKE